MAAANRAGDHHNDDLHKRGETQLMAVTDSYIYMETAGSGSRRMPVLDMAAGAVRR
jgi:hypothetical protein